VESVEALRKEQFEEALHSRFRVVPDGAEPIDLTLIQVATRSAAVGWECFSLLFEGPRPAPFVQGLFPIEHAQIGDFPLFLVAVQTDATGQHYEAVFNRRAPTE